MTLSNTEKPLESLFYQVDTIYIGARTSEHPKCVKKAISGTSHLSNR